MVNSPPPGIYGYPEEDDINIVRNENKKSTKLSLSPLLHILHDIESQFICWTYKL